MESKPEEIIPIDSSPPKDSIFIPEDPKPSVTPPHTGAAADLEKTDAVEAISHPVEVIDEVPGEGPFHDTKLSVNLEDQGVRGSLQESVAEEGMEEIPPNSDKAAAP